MKKMNEAAMKAANGGYTFYCVCGHTESGSGFWGEFKAAVRYNKHIKYCVEAHEAGIV